MNPCVIAINSAPRKGAEYLGTMLEDFFSIGAAGDLPVSIYSDVGKEGCALSALNFCKRLAVEFPGYDVLWFEDDVIPCLNALQAASLIDFPAGCGLLSFFNNRDRFTAAFGVVDVLASDYVHSLHYKDVAVSPALHLRPSKTGLRFAQAGKYKAELIAFIASLEPEDFILSDRIDGRDESIGHAIVKAGYQFNGLMVPNWFEHIGQVSAWDMENVDRSKWIKSGNWCGANHDALTDLGGLNAWAKISPLPW